MPKTVKGGPFGLLGIQFVAKYAKYQKKLKDGPFGDIKIFSKK